MTLTRHQTSQGPTWAVDGIALPQGMTLGFMLGVPAENTWRVLGNIVKNQRKMDAPEIAGTPMIAPIEDDQEVWAAGVTYLRSKVEREAESTVADVYGKVYEAERPELFFKSIGARVVGDGGKIRIRGDSAWNVPEPELAVFVNKLGEVLGYAAGNDVSSRSIEGENPLYLPQAKVYDGACALGPRIVLAPASEMSDLPISLTITRAAEMVFSGEASTSQMKRSLSELTEHLIRETAFPKGVVLLTGTCIVPPSDFTLQAGDQVLVKVGEATLLNSVDAGPVTR